MFDISSFYFTSSQTDCDKKLTLLIVRPAIYLQKIIGKNHLKIGSKYN